MNNPKPHFRWKRVKQVENEWDFKMNVTKIVYIMEVLSIERDNR